MAAWRSGIGIGAHPVLEDQFEFGRGGQAFEAFLVGERRRARGWGRCCRGGFHDAAVVGFDQGERRGRFRAAVVVEQGSQIHGLITSLE